MGILVKNLEPKHLLAKVHWGGRSHTIDAIFGKNPDEMVAYLIPDGSPEESVELMHYDEIYLLQFKEVALRTKEAIRKDLLECDPCDKQQKMILQAELAEAMNQSLKSRRTDAAESSNQNNHIAASASAAV